MDKKNTMIELIASAVCKEYSVTIDDIRNKCRKGEFVEPRQVICYMCKEKGMKQREIGRYINRDQSTTYASWATIKTQLTVDRFLQFRVQKCRTKINVDDNDQHKNIKNQIVQELKMIYGSICAGNIMMMKKRLEKVITMINNQQ